MNFTRKMDKRRSIGICNFLLTPVVIPQQKESQIFIKYSKRIKSYKLERREDTSKNP